MQLRVGVEEGVPGEGGARRMGCHGCATVDQRLMFSTVKRGMR
jgi:hypothetical protein